MFKRTVALSLAGALLFAPLWAQAQIELRPYIGGDLANWTYELPGFDSGGTIGMRFRGGLEINPNLAVEGHLFTGADDQLLGRPSGNEVPQIADMNLDWGGALMVRGGLQLPFYPRLLAFATVGMSTARAKTSISGQQTTESESGVSYGAGLEFHGTDHVFLNIDWVQYLDESFKISSLNFGLRYRF